VLVDAVRSDSPAARAGLQVGDVVTDVAGDPTTSATDVVAALAGRKHGDQVAVVAIRDHQRVELRATIADDPGPRPAGLGHADPLGSSPRTDRI
jgi:S1-C subfamily serine protease